MIEPLYHQAVKGLKTQTRRSSGLEMVNGAPEVKKKGKVIKPAIIANPGDWELVRFNDNHAKFFKKNDALNEVYCRPRYKVGEVLYLKEPMSKFKLLLGVEKNNGLITETWGKVYKYSGLENKSITRDGLILPNHIESWDNKLFMPAEAARAYVRITGIKCERLLDISDEDCIAEGIEYVTWHGEGQNNKHNYYKDYETGKVNRLFSSKDSFFSLFRFANKISPKKDIGNPWVWAYTFEYLKDYKHGN